MKTSLEKSLLALTISLFVLAGCGATPPPEGFRIGATKNQDQLGGSIRVAGFKFTQNGQVLISITGIPRIPNGRSWTTTANRPDGGFASDSETFRCVSGTDQEAD